MRLTAIHLRQPPCRHGLTWLLLIAALMCALGRTFSQQAIAQDARKSGPELSDTPTVEELLAAWEAGAGRLGSYDAYVTMEHRQFMSNDGKRSALAPVQRTEMRQ